jgi:hypothetical protein
MDRAATLAPRLARRLAAAGFAVLGTALPIMGFSQLGPTDAGIGIKLGLAQRNNSGEVGDVTLVERGASTTLVIIRLAQEPDGRQQPAHIHRGRDCATLDPKPAYGLAPVIDQRHVADLAGIIALCEAELDSDSGIGRPQLREPRNR